MWYNITITTILKLFWKQNIALFLCYRYTRSFGAFPRIEVYKFILNGAWILELLHLINNCPIYWIILEWIKLERETETWDIKMSTGHYTPSPSSLFNIGALIRERNNKRQNVTENSRAGGVYFINTMFFFVFFNIVFCLKIPLKFCW